MSHSFLIIFIITHVLVVSVYITLIFTHRSSLTPANILPILFIPFFGVLSALIADIVTLSNRYRARRSPEYCSTGRSSHHQ
jgi:hypothetical protein